MLVTRVLAVAPVSDIEQSVAWYERLLARPADRQPMPGLADWHLTPNGWLQVYQDPEHAGSTLINLQVDDLDRALADLAARGLPAGPVQTGGRISRFAAVHDPDGNRVTLVENPVS
ncbi:VOC family protein [Streptomyces sp. NPDC060028]|uniref:VOC family protein n=1 Tax=Streptomyces sp. NPDC060028 TaxID=3347041 RepID=UPI0036C904EB